MTEQSKKTTLLALIVLTTLPFICAVNMPDSLSLSASNSKPLTLYVSAIAGYVGVSIMLWQFILGTRSATGLLFKDLPWVIRLHTKLGIWGTLLIFLHPLLITYSYGESLLYTITPDLSNEFEKHISFGRLALIVLIIVWFSSAVLRRRMAYRPWKYVHYLAYLALPASLLHTPEVGSSFGNTAIQIYWYAFISIFLAFIILRARYIFTFGKLSFTATSHEQLNESVRVLRLKPNSHHMQINLGQYIYLQRSVYSEEHPFTVLESDNDSGEIAIAYKVFGKFTKKLSLVKPGHKMLIDGPYGQFTHELNINPKLPAIFIAGGIGITPFASHIMQADSSARHILIYANRTKKSAVFRGALSDKLGDRFIEIFSQETKIDGARQEVGLLNTKTLNKYIDNPQEYTYFICGPKGMMGAARSSLLEIGVPRHNIHVEEFGF